MSAADEALGPVMAVTRFGLACNDENTENSVGSGRGHDVAAQSEICPLHSCQAERRINWVALDEALLHGLGSAAERSSSPRFGAL